MILIQRSLNNKDDIINQKIMGKKIKKIIDKIYIGN